MHGFYTLVLSDQQDVPPIEGYQGMERETKEITEEKKRL
jgi:hypothetical protein